MIGITERGDAGLDLSWTESMDTVAGAILITKHVHRDDFLSAAMEYRDKVIIHATITGYGNTFIEPNVPSFEQTTRTLVGLTEYFPADRLVLRIDPIVPTENGLERVRQVLQAVPEQIKRVRFSFIDQYRHVRQRMVKAGVALPWTDFNAPISIRRRAVEWLQQNIVGREIECCAERGTFIPDEWRIGCVSPKDLNALSLVQERRGYSTQRVACLCIADKTELLKHKGQCPSGCLYCYWR